VARHRWGGDTVELRGGDEFSVDDVGRRGSLEHQGLGAGVRQSLNGRVVAQDHPSLEGAETAAAARTPSQKKGSPATEAGRRRSGWCGGALGCLGAEGS
jgi:hypothetical protein